ncbi:tyrosine-type recombinase/integrase [Sorangium sp. So ce385]|uniref:tyrosine-type recombinase/integrase n=1 Tax=Sorangium sp. So ce385 TaxID=3133308 RepID=UPI003F5C7A03
MKQQFGAREWKKFYALRVRRAVTMATRGHPARPVSTRGKPRRGVYVDVRRLGPELYGRQITDPRDGKRKWIRGKTPGEVLTRIELIRKQIEDAKLGLISHEELVQRAQAAVEGLLTVQKAWESHVSALSPRWGPKAKGYWRRYLMPYFDGCAAAHLTEDRMRQWEDWMLTHRVRRRGEVRPLAAKTIKNVFDLLKAAFNRAIGNKRLAALPWGKWSPRGGGKGPEREACRSTTELLLLVRAAAARDARTRASRGFADLAYRVLVAALSGLRQGELAGLGWDDFDNLDGEIPVLGTRVILRVRHQAIDGWRLANPTWTRPLTPPKHRDGDDNADKPQELHPVAVWALRQQREQLRARGWYRPDGPVFPAAWGKRPGDWRSHGQAIDPEREIRAVVRAAGLPDPERWVTHSLRHTFATLELAAVLASTGDVRAVQERTRHRDRRTLEGYFHRLGRGVAPPGIGAVPLPAELAVVELPTSQPEAPEPATDPWGIVPRPPTDSWGIVPQLDEAAIQRAEDERKLEQREEERQAYLGRRPTDFAKWFVRWVAAGRPGERPREVSEAADRAYRRAYAAKLRGCGRPPSPVELAACKTAGRRARLGTLAAWAKWVKRHEQTVEERYARRQAAPAPLLNSDNAEPSTKGTRRLPSRAAEVEPRYGRLVILERVENRGGRAFYRAQCDCGRAPIEVAGGDLRAGKVVSCGCVKAEHGRAQLRRIAKERGARGRTPVDVRLQRAAQRALRADVVPLEGPASDRSP